MKTTNPTLNALLATGQFAYCDIYTMTLRDGTILRYTDADTDIVYGGSTYYCERVFISGIRSTSRLGLETDRMDVKFIPQSTEIIGGVQFRIAARLGYLDRATILKERLFFSDFNQAAAGKVYMFSGEISDVDVTSTEVHASVLSETHLLDTPMPNVIYQPSCTHVFGDSGCGFNRATTQVSGTVSSGSSASQIVCGLAQANGWFDLGVLTMTSGALNGLKRTVNIYTTGNIKLLTPFPSAPANGDTFTVVRGCARTQSACLSLGNSAKFRGFPFVPAAETAI